MRPSSGNACSALSRKVGVAHGVTIDGGVGEGRQRQRRRDIAREHASVGIDERDGLDIGDRIDARGDQANGLVDRHHRSAEGKAIVRQLRHGASSASRGAFRHRFLDRHRRTQQQRRGGLDIIEMDGRQRVSMAMSVAMPTMPGSSGNSSGLPLPARCTSILRCGSRLKPSTTTRSTARQLAQQFRQPRLVGAAQFMHQGPAVRRRHQHLGRAGLAVAPGILAGHIDIELVMGMLDDGNAQALRVEMRDQPRQQRGLARTAPARKADDFHSVRSPPTARQPMEPRPLPVIASAAKQSRLPPRI